MAGLGCVNLVYRLFHPISHYPTAMGFSHHTPTLRLAGIPVHYRFNLEHPSTPSDVGAVGGEKMGAKSNDRFNDFLWTVLLAGTMVTKKQPAKDHKLAFFSSGHSDNFDPRLLDSLP